MAELMKVVLMGLAGREDVLAEARRLQPQIERHVEVVDVDFEGRLDMARVDADMVVVFGGDGSILRAAHRMGERQLPVLAVNLGRLGFLADITPDELPDAVRDLAATGLEGRVIEHLMFGCEIFRQGKLLCSQWGLNEVCVQTGPAFTLIELDLHIDSELVTTYSGDGLIVSTPVGSTAHNLSAGGPILRKDLQAFVISPISPHTLTMRSVVDSADRTYELVIGRADPGTGLTVDGRVLLTVQPEDRIRVRKIEPRFKLVVAPRHSYYKTLREKLGWGGRLPPRNRP
jgi:NAD+ kinase